MPVRISRVVLLAMLDVLRSCGHGERECVCWLTGPLDHRGLVDEVIHPMHSSSPVGYRVHEYWMTERWIILARERREVRVQAHTHPRGAYHSAVDDAFPAAQTAGFISLVIPRFAQSAVGLHGSHVSELGHDGTWRFVPSERALEIVG